MGIDAEIRRLSDKIVNDLNESPIHVGIKRLILHDIYVQVEAKADEIARQELENNLENEKAEEE